MLKYLIILLDDSSVSYCHYSNNNKKNLIPIDILQEGIMFAMKHNLLIQYVLPYYDIPQEYMELINSMFHNKIGSIKQYDIADILVINGWENIYEQTLKTNKKYVIRTSINDFFENHRSLKVLINKCISFNIVFTDVKNFTDNMIDTYSDVLLEISEWIKEAILKGIEINSNIITDRIVLDSMNNCGAADTCITLAPNGSFYPCPAFYYECDPYSELGNVKNGLNIKCQHLYKLECAPLCKRCDAFQCKRCVWLNKKLTLELNTPSHQQCVMAHIERNNSRKLLLSFQNNNILRDKAINDINYLDPFDVYKK